mgnify:CR=1 FL=1
MSPGKTFNLYCDESNHLERDDSPSMVLGALWCEVQNVRSVTAQLRRIKELHGLAPTFESKWTKVSPGKIAYYQDLLEFFSQDPRLRFRGVLIPDKSKLDHTRFGQTHDDWYYKMYFTMLKYIISPSNSYRIYIDIKDTRGAEKTRELHDVLCNNIYDFNHKTIQRVQQIRSDESELLQLADLIIGAIGYDSRGITTSGAKAALVAQLKGQHGPRALTHTSSFSSTKFNLLVWDAQGAKD